MALTTSVTTNGFKLQHDFIRNFYGAMLCIAPTMLSQDVCPSVCLSVCHTPVFCRNGKRLNISYHPTFYRSIKRYGNIPTRTP